MSYFFISSVKSEVLISCPFTTTEVIKRKNVSICFICSLVVLSMHANVLQLPEGGDFEALHSQPSTNFDRSTKLDLTTDPPLLGRCCYSLCFFSRLFDFQFSFVLNVNGPPQSAVIILYFPVLKSSSKSRLMSSQKSFLCSQLILQKTICFSVFK